MGSAQDMDLVMKSTVILERATQIIEGQLRQKLDRTSYAYVRFMAHLRFLIRRLMRGGCKETENSGLFRQAARGFPRRLLLRRGRERIPQTRLQLELLRRGDALPHDARQPPATGLITHIQVVISHMPGPGQAMDK